MNNPQTIEDFKDKIAKELSMSLSTKLDGTIELYTGAKHCTGCYFFDIEHPILKMISYIPNIRITESRSFPMAGYRIVIDCSGYSDDVTIELLTCIVVYLLSINHLPI